MTKQDRHEAKLVNALEVLKFDLLGVTPFANADKFYFYRKTSRDLLNIEIIYNGHGYCLKLGRNNSFKVIDLQYGLNWETMFEHINAFVEKN
jgi:hypothetical protein